jgi:hypothetical protein
VTGASCPTNNFLASNFCYKQFVQIEAARVAAFTICDLKKQKMARPSPERKILRFAQDFGRRLRRRLNASTSLAMTI